MLDGYWHSHFAVNAIWAITSLAIWQATGSSSAKCASKKVVA
jgi:hypothetical protein